MSKEIIKLSSEEEDAASAACNISAFSNNVAGYRQRSRSRSSSSSLSSTLSSSYRSLDYEAEADEEDANECEGAENKRKNSGGNDNLLHVQNFLSCFDEQQRQQKVTMCCTAIPQCDRIRQQQEMQKHHTAVDNKLKGIFVDIAQATTKTTKLNEVESIPITTTTSTAATSRTTKPGKFTISTKFLRKPRHKLKSVNMTPTTDSNKVKTTTTPISSQKLMVETMCHTVELQAQQQQTNKQQLQQQRTQCEEPNVKFNSNFSINSLLNKR